MVKNNPLVVGLVPVGVPDKTNGSISKSCCVALPFTPIVEWNVFLSGVSTPGFPSVCPVNPDKPVNPVTEPNSVDEYS